MSPALKLLRELVALPSVNPAFLPAGHPAAGEQRVAEFLAATAARAGLDIEFQTVAPGRANLVARLSPPSAPRRRVLLAPHLDTVNAEPAQFIPRVKSGRLYARGACDTKGSITAMLGALLDVARGRSRPRETEIVFVGLIDEEHSQLGSRALANSGFQADLAIVGEPTGLQVVTAHKGSLWLRLQTHGRAAHGATPHLGKNAVHEMARVVDLLQCTYADQLRVKRHPLLGTATVNVGAIVGGSQANIVPDHCSILVDRRTLPGENESSVRRGLAALLKANGLRAHLASEKLLPCLPLETDTRLPLVADFLSSMRQSRPIGVNYFCDASVLSQGGIPSVVFGPGDIAQAHTTNEWLSLRQLEAAQARLTRFLTGLP